MKHIGLGSVLVVIAAMLTACAGNDSRMVVECHGLSPKDPRPGGAALAGKEYGMQMSPIPLDAVVFTNQALARKVAVQMLSAGRTPTDNVSVVARVVNCSDDPVQLGVRTSFMDDKQRPTEPPSVWRSVFVQPRAMGVYTEVSLGRDEVTHYLVEIRNSGAN